MAEYLLDTNHASALMGEAEPLFSLVSRAVRVGNQFGISTTVLGELFYAVYASQRQRQNLARLRRMIAGLFILPFDSPASEELGRVRAEQKRKGRPIPPSDAQIAAVARLHGLTLLTADHHFQFIDNLSVENWLQPN